MKWNADRTWFWNKMILIQLIDIAMIFCTVLAASWGGLMIAQLGSLFGIMWVAWVLVVGYTSKNSLKNWLFTKLIVPEFGKPESK